MDCPWTSEQKAIFFDAFLFLSNVPNLKATLDSREMMLSYKESHTHINYFFDFESVAHSLSNFLKDFKEYNKENHSFYLHDEITSKEFHKKMEENFNSKIFKSASYIPRKDMEEYNETLDRIISGSFFLK